MSTAWPSAGPEAWNQQLVSGRGEQVCGTLRKGLDSPLSRMCAGKSPTTCVLPWIRGHIIL